MKDKIDKILEEHEDLFRDLADALVCPKCGEVVHGEKFNLGEAYGWCEGCKECADAIANGRF